MNAAVKFTIGMVLVLALVPAAGFAGQSTITNAGGYACMGDDKSKRQTESEALANARRNAAENASTYITTETKVKNFELEKDLINAYAKAEIRVIEVLDKSWYRDPAAGDCFRMQIKAEVIPDEKSLKQAAVDKDMIDDPAAPLRVKVWTDKKDYRSSEKIRIFIRGNRPFFARILYKDVKGSLLQLLPNPHRKDNYFQGGVIYELPAGTDEYDLTVTPPFGRESIIVYASTEPQGDVNVESAGAVYQVLAKPELAGMQTRGIKFSKKEKTASGFYESSLDVSTSK
ncbi:MAG: DUF4384 domain-containing protein [Syntrophaceae bacterium]